MADGNSASRACRGCGERKPLDGDHFYAAPTEKTGFRFRCKACERRRAIERQRLRLSDPAVYAATLIKNRDRARIKRGPRAPVPLEKACGTCGVCKPFTPEHFSPRMAGILGLVSRCKPCRAQAARDKRATDPDARARHVAAVIKSQAARAARDPVFAAKQKTDMAVRRKRRRADPAKRAIELAQERAWRKANWDRVKMYKHKCGALNAAHAARTNAGPAAPHWSETERINELYERARELTMTTGVKHNVDHFYPLRGRSVSGLHVFANLQILTEHENKTKSNKVVEEPVPA